MASSKIKYLYTGFKKHLVDEQTIDQFYNGEKIYLDKFRVYGKVDNIYTFTKYMGYDPTASTGDPIGQGIDYGFYPLPRTFSIGVNLQF